MPPEPGSRNGCHKMRYITLATIAAVAVGVAVTAHAESASAFNDKARTFFSEAGPEASSVASLNALLAEWDHAGFSAPGKPGQSRVYGRDGYVTTGGGYNFMVTLIRSAVNDVREGRDQEVAPKIAKARILLAASNSRKA
jgi:hypothetical protein